MTPICGLCKRERKPEDKDYSVIQWLNGLPLGWYSGKDGEVCPECMTDMMMRQL